MFDIHLSKEYCIYAKEILYRIGDKLDNSELDILYNAFTSINLLPIDLISIELIDFGLFSIEIIENPFNKNVETFLVIFLIVYKDDLYGERHRLMDIHNILFNEELTYNDCISVYPVAERKFTNQIEKFLEKEFKTYLNKRINHV